MKATSLSSHPHIEGIKTEESVSGYPGDFSEALGKACVHERNKVRIHAKPSML